MSQYLYFIWFMLHCSLACDIWIIAFGSQLNSVTYIKDWQALIMDHGAYCDVFKCFTLIIGVMCTLALVDVIICALGKF